MKKRLGILSGLFTVGCIAAFGSDADFVTYTNEVAVAIAGYTGTNTVVTFPAKINGIPVTTIFGLGRQDLTVITVPASVSYLKPDVFEGNSNLKTVYFLGDAPYLERVKGCWYGLEGTHAIVCYMPGHAGFGEFIQTVPWDPTYSVVVAEWDARAAIQQTSTGACVTVTGNTNLNAVCVYACTNLANPNWVPVTTSLNLANGPVSFEDTNPPPMRFYSVGWPQ